MCRVAKLVHIAEALGTSVSKLAIAWCLLNSNVFSVILGASKVEQLAENLLSVDVLPLLTEDVQAQLAAI